MLCAGCVDGLEPLNTSIESTLEVDPEGDISFGRIPAGAEAGRQLTLHAIGGSPLSIDEVYLSDAAQGAFSMEAMTAPFGVMANESVVVELFFQPDEVGSFSGHVYISEGGRERSRRLIGHACAPSNNSDGCP